MRPCHHPCVAGGVEVAQVLLLGPGASVTAVTLRTHEYAAWVPPLVKIFGLSCDGPAAQRLSTTQPQAVGPRVAGRKDAVRCNDLRA